MPLTSFHGLSPKTFASALLGEQKGNRVVCGVVKWSPWVALAITVQIIVDKITNKKIEDSWTTPLGILKAILQLIFGSSTFLLFAMFLSILKLVPMKQLFKHPKFYIFWASILSDAVFRRFLVEDRLCKQQISRGWTVWIMIGAEFLILLVVPAVDAFDLRIWPITKKSFLSC